MRDRDARVDAYVPHRMLHWQMAKVQSNFVLGWFQKTCRQYAEGEWDDGVEEFYRTLWLPLRSNPEKGAKHFGGELCFEKHQDCTPEEFNARIAFAKPPRLEEVKTEATEAAAKATLSATKAKKAKKKGAKKRKRKRKTKAKKEL